MKFDVVLKVSIGYNIEGFLILSYSVYILFCVYCKIIDGILVKDIWWDLYFIFELWCMDFLRKGEVEWGGWDWR